MLSTGLLAPAPRAGAVVGTIELREAQSAPRQRQPSAMRKPWPMSGGVSRRARALRTQKRALAALNETEEG